MDIIKETKLIGNYVIALRKYFHRHPELSLKEFLTSKKIKSELDKISVDYVETAGTGVAAFIGNGSRRTIALRSDMDGILINENTGLPYESENKGILHACGHDAHMAALLGAAIILKKYEDMLPGRVLLLFQPAEENSMGAKLISEEGILDDVDEIFGLHVFGDIECGKISIEKGPRMAASNKFIIKIKGRSGHAGKPNQCIDATVVCAAIIMNLQSIISREMNPLEEAVVTIGHAVSGKCHNVISGEALIEGTVRTFSMSTSRHIEKSIKRITYGTAASYGATAEVDYNISSHPAVINDEEAVKTAVEGAARIFNQDDLVHIPPMMLGEDFSIYQKKIPGVFAFVGAGNEELGRDYPNHNERFNIDEKAVLICTALYTGYALEALKKESRKH